MSESKVYVTTKIVVAWPKSKLEMFSSDPTKYGSAEDEPGYEIRYPDGYVSWCPKEEFERTSREVSGQETSMMIVCGPKTA